MTVTLTDSRTKSLRDSCLALLDPSSPSVTSVRDVAKTVGTILASFPAVTYGVLHYFSFAEDKKAGLKANWGDFDGSMSLSNTSRELEWWISNLPKAYNDIYVSDPKVVLNSDANLQAWGGGGGGGVSVKAVQQGAMVPCWKDVSYQLSRTAGGILCTEVFLTQVAGKTCETDDCYHHSCGMYKPHGYKPLALLQQPHPGHLVLGHSPRHLDQCSPCARKEKCGCRQGIQAWGMEIWPLSVAGSTQRLGSLNLGVSPTTDLFASRLNAQLKQYMSYRPDPAAVAVDAFSIFWREVILCFLSFQHSGTSHPEETTGTKCWNTGLPRLAYTAIAPCGATPSPSPTSKTTLHFTCPASQRQFITW